MKGSPGIPSLKSSYRQFPRELSREPSPLIWPAYRIGQPATGWFQVTVPSALMHALNNAIAPNNAIASIHQPLHYRRNLFQVPLLNHFEVLKQSEPGQHMVSHWLKSNLVVYDSAM